MTKAELFEENDALLNLVDDIQNTVNLPEDLQDRVDGLLGDDEEEDE